MSKYGYNEKELRKTIITKIDKDGFHNRTVTYGKDSGGSGSCDWSIAKVTFIDSNSSGEGYPVLCPMVVDTGDPEMGTVFTMSVDRASHDNPLTVDIPLFKGTCYITRGLMLTDGKYRMDIAPVLTGNVTLSGNMYIITGDATITLVSIGDEPPADEPPAE